MALCLLVLRIVVPHLLLIGLSRDFNRLPTGIEKP